MEDFLAWVATHFTDEMTLLDEMTTAMLNRIDDDDAFEDALEQALEKFMDHGNSC